MKPDLHRDAKARAAYERVWRWVRRPRRGRADPDEAALRKSVADDQLRPKGLDTTEGVKDWLAGESA